MANLKDNDKVKQALELLASEGITVDLCSPGCPTSPTFHIISGESEIKWVDGKESITIDGQDWSNYIGMKSVTFGAASNDYVPRVTLFLKLPLSKE